MYYRRMYIACRPGHGSQDQAAGHNCGRLMARLRAGAKHSAKIMH